MDCLTALPLSMPNPLSHHPTMLKQIRNTLPPLWWLNPWAYARSWHSALWAVKDYADRADRALDLQTRVMEDQSKEIQTLRRQVREVQAR